jgi:protein involved in polysaccharide export with SLBB domain
MKRTALTHRHPAALALPLVWLILSFSGCYYSVTNEPLPAPERSAATAPMPPPFHLNTFLLNLGDQLAVKFYQNPQLDEDVVIRPDGKISLQLIGAVDAVGRTPEALAAEIESAYRSELTTPRVTVIVRQLGVTPVYVGGEVGNPGIVSLTPGLTLFQAIQQAGGLLQTAHEKQVVLIRRDAEGHPVGYSVDVRPIAGGKNPGVDVPLFPYDIAFVPRSKIADVNLFVNQYIRNTVPFPIFVPYTLFF